MKLKLIAVLFFAIISNLWSQVIITNNIPTKLPVGSDVEIEVKINKAGIANFAKYQMDVPNGVVISEVDSRTGNFTFENNRAKIVWVSVPGESEFIVKFKVFVNSLAPLQANIIQKFYFLEGGNKREIDVPAITVAFGSGTPLATGSTKSQSTPTPSATNANVQTVSSINVENANSENNLIYRIQLASSPTEPVKNKYASLGTGLEILKEEGNYKVLYGKFNTKEEALKMLDEVGAKGFAGYTVKYQNGVRVK